MLGKSVYVWKGVSKRGKRKFQGRGTKIWQNAEDCQRLPLSFCRNKTCKQIILLLCGFSLPPKKYIFPPKKIYFLQEIFHILQHCHHDSTTGMLSKTEM